MGCHRGSVSFCKLEGIIVKAVAKTNDSRRAQLCNTLSLSEHSSLKTSLVGMDGVTLLLRSRNDES